MRAGGDASNVSRMGMSKIRDIYRKILIREVKYGTLPEKWET